MRSAIAPRMAAVRAPDRSVIAGSRVEPRPPLRLETLYVGGGTPSLLGASAMRALRDVVGPERLESPALEWTAEANPESFDRALGLTSRAGSTKVET